MKRNKLAITCTLILSGSILLTSCVGSFSLFNHLVAWNQNVKDKYVNELVFVALQPVYAVCYITDALVINSIEFWTGTNPMANIGEVKNIKGENGEYTVERLRNGYLITKDKENMKLLFNEKLQTWSVESKGTYTTLLKINNNKTAQLYLPTGNSINITMDAKGLYAAHQAITDKAYLASK